MHKLGAASRSRPLVPRADASRFAIQLQIETGSVKSYLRTSLLLLKLSTGKILPHADQNDLSELPDSIYARRPPRRQDRALQEMRWRHHPTGSGDGLFIYCTSFA